MAKFTVTSDNFSGKKVGDVVDSSDLEGLAVDALVEGGHLAPMKDAPKKFDNKEAQV